jgi:hypothetical protein
MPAIHTLHWQSNSICLLPEPVTERRPSSCPCSKFATQPVLGMRDDLDLTTDLSRLIDNAHRGFFDRDIQTRVVFHAALLPLWPEATANDPRCTISLQCSTSPGIEGSGGRPNTHLMTKC